MVVTVFRSRLRDDVPDEFHETADRLAALAAALPGFVEYAFFQAEDGERLTLVTFDSPEAHRTWRDHPEHQAAQQRGRERFYESFSTQVMETDSAIRSWDRPT